jgi:hypothetical protein
VISFRALTRTRCFFSVISRKHYRRRRRTVRRFRFGAFCFRFLTDFETNFESALFGIEIVVFIVVFFVCLRVRLRDGFVRLAIIF